MYKSTPSPSQLMFAEDEIGAFFHYGINTFTGDEHGCGSWPASAFCPPKPIDFDQWLRVAKSTGARYACFTARHEEGFCLWPTKSTDYSIESSPHHGNDLVRNFVNACHRQGVKPGFYHSCYHDAHHTFNPGSCPTWGQEWDSLCNNIFLNPSKLEQFTRIQLTQIEELLTNYGPIYYLWLDHYGCPGTGAADLWRTIANRIRQLQPECLIMGIDTTTPGNETGHVTCPLWNPVETTDGTAFTLAIASASSSNNYGLLETSVVSGNPNGAHWRVRECPTNVGFHTEGWFWHPAPREPKPLQLDCHIDLYRRTVGLGANLIINLPVNSEGVVPDDIATAAERFGSWKKSNYGSPIAKTSGVDWEIIQIFQNPTVCSEFIVAEDISKGQTVVDYEVYLLFGNEWSKIAQGETVGHKIIITIPACETTGMRFLATRTCDGNPPAISEFSAY